MNILFVTSTRIGDAVLSTGLLSHLISRHPGARITVACGPVPAPLFRAVPGLEQVIVLHKKKLATHWPGLWLACLPHLWDLVVDLRGSGLAWLLCARKRKVLRRQGEPAHRIEELGALLGLSPPPSPTLWLEEADRGEASHLIPAGTPVLALGPTANWVPKTWPAKNFVELAGRLTAPGGILPGAPIALFGAAHERAGAEAVRAALPADRCIDLVGGIDLATAAACLARCALYVGNDSGLMHVAAAGGTPTLGLFGPSPAERYAPWGDHGAVARTAIPYGDLVNAPGFDHRATDNLMTSLTVDEVERAANELWRQCPVPAA